MSFLVKFKSKKKEKRKKPSPVLLDPLALAHLLLIRQDVLFAHADLEALPEPAPLAEPAVGHVHLALLLVRALEVVLGKIRQDKISLCCPVKDTFVGKTVGMGV